MARRHPPGTAGARRSRPDSRGTPGYCPWSPAKLPLWMSNARLTASVSIARPSGEGSCSSYSVSHMPVVTSWRLRTASSGGSQPSFSPRTVPIAVLENWPAPLAGAAEDGRHRAIGVLVGGDQRRLRRGALRIRGHRLAQGRIEDAEVHLVDLVAAQAHGMGGAGGGRARGNDRANGARDREGRRVPRRRIDERRQQSRDDLSADHHVGLAPGGRELFVSPP